MPRILSTKKLSSSQKELLLNAGCSIVEQEFITIIPLPFQIKDIPDHIIFTSKNAVNLILEKKPDLGGKKIFCVGNKTAELLKKNDLQVLEIADNGLELAEKIVTGYRDKEFLFFCGRKRRKELPDLLRQQGVVLSETEVYDTQPLKRRIDRIFDGVLFFSPSAVQSFCALNELSRSTAFCIGATTASKAEKYTDKIEVAKKPTVENVIVRVVKHFGRM